MKNDYSKPCIKTILIQQTSHILEGSGVYTDDPQSPGSALSRQNRDNSWWDEDK